MFQIDIEMAGVLDEKAKFLDRLAKDEEATAKEKVYIFLGDRS